MNPEKGALDRAIRAKLGELCAGRAEILAVFLCGSRRENLHRADSDVDAVAILAAGDVEYHGWFAVDGRDYPLELRAKAPEALRQAIAEGDLALSGSLASGEILSDRGRAGADLQTAAREALAARTEGLRGSLAAIPRAHLLRLVRIAATEVRALILSEERPMPRIAQEARFAEFLGDFVGYVEFLARGGFPEKTGLFWSGGRPARFLNAAKYPAPGWAADLLGSRALEWEARFAELETAFRGAVGMDLYLAPADRSSACVANTFAREGR